MIDQHQFNVKFLRCSHLEALSVDDIGSGLVVFLLADPHLLECGHGGQDRSADPD